MRHYRVIFVVEVDLKVADEVIERALIEDFPYSHMDEESTIEMLAYNLGLNDRQLDHLDGWADMDCRLAEAHRVDIELDDWERLNDVV